MAGKASGRIGAKLQVDRKKFNAKIVNIAILPRQGEVAPKATEGEDTHWRLPFPPPPSGYACHLPLAGEDREVEQPIAALRYPIP